LPIKKKKILVKVRAQGQVIDFAKKKKSPREITSDRLARNYTSRSLKLRIKFLIESKIQYSGVSG
jgi:hypothetical protein